MTSTKNGTKAPEQFAREKQEENIETVAEAAARGDLKPLQERIAAEREKRNKLAEKNWKNYRLFKGAKDAFPVGIETPMDFRYLRDSENGGFTVRYCGCPDQEYVDRINALAEGFGLAERLETKHERIYQLRMEAGRRGELTWRDAGGGVWVA